MDKEKISLWTGLGVFFLGVVLLVLTFYIAYTVFTNPSSLVGFKALVPEIEGGIESLVGMISYIIAVLLLWVMGSVGGKIAKHGYKMFTSKN